tara:strand:+ start:4591 stop:4974 length:384 start_codon:yes stop_codon:yes gene_type:complete
MILKELSKTSKANKLLVTYYRKKGLEETIDLFVLLEKDIRIYYGVFVDFFANHGIILDVNKKGYCVYVNSDNIEYNGKAKEWLFDYEDGRHYITKKYLEEHTDKKISTIIKLNMKKAILKAMEWLNI